MLLCAPTSSASIKSSGIGEKEFGTSCTPHNPIYITSDSQFESLGLEGSGTSNEPYIIESLEIRNRTTCIEIRHTNASVVIRNCILALEGGFGHGSEGISLYNASNIVVEDNMIDIDYSPYSYRFSHGIRVYYSKNVVVRSNQVFNATRSIALAHCEECDISGNTLLDFEERGIEVGETNNTEICNNTIINRLQYEIPTGIFLAWHSTSCLIAQNEVSDAFVGIRLWQLNYSSIEENHVTDCSTGIMIGLSSFVEVKKNNLTLNRQGIYFDEDTSENTIEENYVRSEQTNAIDNGVDNQWSGNWWSDYNGIGGYLISGSAGSKDSSPQGNGAVLHIILVGGLGLLTILIAAAVLVVRKRKLG